MSSHTLQTDLFALGCPKDIFALLDQSLGDGQLGAVSSSLGTELEGGANHPCLSEAGRTGQQQTHVLLPYKCKQVNLSTHE